MFESCLWDHTNSRVLSQIAGLLQCNLSVLIYRAFTPISPHSSEQNELTVIVKNFNLFSSVRRNSYELDLEIKNDGIKNTLKCIYCIDNVA